MLLHWLRKIPGFKPAPNAGERGEQTAASWLVRERGVKVLARNWRNPRDRRDEIDLVCLDHEVLVFVEVKARVTGALVPGFYAVDARKKRVLRRTIKAYLAQLRVKPTTFRFDVVEVTLPNGPAAKSRPGLPLSSPVAPPDPEVLHFENVALFPKGFRA
ncbi:MAG: YraN family protein [Opitutaceae bacterium]